MKSVRKLLSKNRLARGMFRSLNYPYTIQLNGKKVKAMKLYDSRLTVSELWMSELLMPLFALRDGAFIDVGANLGQTLSQVMTIDPNRSYVGFEPNPACNLYLQELVRRNSFVKAKLIPVGLHTDNQLKELLMYNENVTDAGASVVEGYWSYTGKEPVNRVVVPMMDFETVENNLEIGAFHFVKIDVEGAELEVLLSMEKRINQFRPYIIAEILSAYSYENSVRVERQKGIVNFSLRNNYLMYRIMESNGGGIQKLMPIDEFDPGFDKDQCNYLFVPSEESSNVSAQFSGYLST